MCFSSLRDSNVSSSFPITIGTIVLLGRPVVKTLSFQCRGPSSIPGQGTNLTGHVVQTKYILGFPGGSAGKEFACSAGDLGLIPGWGREWLPIPVFCPGEFHGLYSPWGCKESDTAEWLFTFIEIYIPQGKAENKFLLPIQQDDRKGSPRTIYPPWTHWFRNISSTDFLCKKSRESLKRSSS